ncbi:MAG: hypothetical protein ACRDNK_04335 [Solirubrobacteraceae bacterium]
MDQQPQPAPPAPAPTVPAASDSELFFQWRSDMRGYADRLIADAQMMEETATQSRARATMSRTIGEDLHKVLDTLELPRRVPDAALHEALVESPPNVFERVHPGAQ